MVGLTLDQLTERGTVSELAVSIMSTSFLLRPRLGIPIGFEPSPTTAQTCSPGPFAKPCTLQSAIFRNCQITPVVQLSRLCEPSARTASCRRSPDGPPAAITPENSPGASSSSDRSGTRSRHVVESKSGGKLGKVGSRTLCRTIVPTSAGRQGQQQGTLGIYDCDNLPCRRCRPSSCAWTS